MKEFFQANSEKRIVADSMQAGEVLIKVGKRDSNQYRIYLSAENARQFAYDILREAAKS